MARSSSALAKVVLVAACLLGSMVLLASPLMLSRAACSPQDGQSGDEASASQLADGAAQELTADDSVPLDHVLEPEAVELLHEMIDRYRKIDAIHLAGRMLTTAPSPGGPREMEWEFEIAIEFPGRHMSRSKNPMFSIVSVFDGDKTWTWVDNQNSYTVVNGSEGGPGTQIPMPGVNFDTAHEEDELLGPILGARELELAQVTIGEENFECRVLELIVQAPTGGPMPVEMPPSIRRIFLREKDLMALRVEEDRKIPARGVRPAQELSIVVSLSQLDYGEPLDSALFVFTPPVGATKVDELPLPGRAKPSDLTGKPASDFELEDLDGNSVALSSLKGKVVLLDFWASWCGPCKMELPHVDALAKEFSDQGLVVYGVNSEAATNAKRFLEKTPLSFPTLVDARSKVSQQYSVSAIPTVIVIDREGVVSAYKVGYQNEAALRALLEEVGIQ